MLRQWLLPLSLFLPQSVSLVSAACYRPDGTDRNVGLSLTSSQEQWYQPCKNTNSGDSEHGMCCRTTDTCRFDGLCTNGQRIVWRESCTDKTWQDPNCVKLCAGTAIGYNGKPDNSTDVPITVCSDGSMCCGPADFASACCANKQGFFVAADKQVYAATASRAPASSPTPTATSPPSDSKHTNTPPPSKEPPLAAIIGGVVGGIAALALAIGGLIFIRRRRARDRDNDTLVGSPAAYVGYVKPHGDAQEVLVMDRFQEMRGYRGSAQELDGEQLLHMLDSDLGGGRKDSHFMRGRLGGEGNYRI